MNPDPLQVALEAATAAGDLVRDAFSRPVDVRYKADASPVTAADEGAERLIRERIEAAFPDHGFYGEETGRANADASHLWLVDPIDGTKAFVRGYPLFSVQVALMHRGEIIVGVSHAPCWNGGETLHAVRGQGAWSGSRRLAVSGVDTLSRATLSTGNLATLAASPRWPRLGALIPRLHRIRGYGDFLHYHWLASGRLDAVLESDVNVLDIAALSLIVQEAGGTFTDLDGRPVGLDTRSVLATNAALRADVEAALSE